MPNAAHAAARRSKPQSPLWWRRTQPAQRLRCLTASDPPPNKPLLQSQQTLVEGTAERHAVTPRVTTSWGDGSDLVCALRIRRVASCVLIVASFACRRGDVASPPPPLTAEHMVGSYRLASIAWVADEPFRALPAWSWPGRVLVLNGSLDLRADGHFTRSERSRTTLFGDTTFSEATQLGSWSMQADTVLLQIDARNAPQTALLSNTVLTTYSGGFESGGARQRYVRQ